jgi:putative transposase
MNRSYRYRIYPNKQQAALIDKTFDGARFVYNKMLQERKDAWEKYKGDPAALKSHRYLLPAGYKKDRPWLKEIDSLALANAYLHLEAAYRNFFGNRENYAFPRFKSKRRDRKTYTTNNQKNSIRIESGGKTLRLPKLQRIRIKLHRPLPANAQIKAATVSLEVQGQYYVSLLLEIKQQVKPVTPSQDTILGIDSPPGWLYQDSNLEGARLPANCRKTQKKLDKALARLSTKQKGGKRRLKHGRKIAKLYAKAAHQRKDLLHKLSRRIANAWEAVAVKERGGEDLRRDGFATFKRMLAYKLEEQGKPLIVIKQEQAAAGRIKLEGCRLLGVA